MQVTHFAADFNPNGDQGAAEPSQIPSLGACFAGKPSRLADAPSLEGLNARVDALPPSDPNEIQARGECRLQQTDDFKEQCMLLAIDRRQTLETRGAAYRQFKRMEERETHRRMLAQQRQFASERAARAGLFARAFQFQATEHTPRESAHRCDAPSRAGPDGDGDPPPAEPPLALCFLADLRIARAA
jgi:hypothetical protein